VDGADSRADVFAKSVRVKTTHLGYKKTVKKVARKNAREHRFHCEEFNAEVTVEQYFQRSRYLLD
jgi:eukaryotic translation initiation factor 2C